MNESDFEVEQELIASASMLFQRVSTTPTTDDNQDSATRLVIEALAGAGFLGLGIEEGRGGSGGTLRMAGLAAEVAGAHRAAVLFLQQSLAAHAAAELSRMDLIQALTGGQTMGVVFFDDGGGLPSASPAAITDGEAIFLFRNQVPVPLGRLTELFDRDDDTWLVPGWGDLRLRANTLDLPLPTGPTWPRGIEFCNGMVSMSLVGLVGRLLANTATYVTDRKQFGVPVGSFQAIKHSLAEVYIELTHARSLTLGALDALDRGDAEASRLLSLSKAAANAIAEESLRCLQAMGGVGFTWESDVHLFVKQSLRLRQWPQAHLRLRSSLRI